MSLANLTVVPVQTATYDTAGLKADDTAQQNGTIPTDFAAALQAAQTIAAPQAHSGASSQAHGTDQVIASAQKTAQQSNLLVEQPSSAVMPATALVLNQSREFNEHFSITSDRQLAATPVAKQSPTAQADPFSLRELPLNAAPSITSAGANQAPAIASRTAGNVALASNPAVQVEADANGAAQNKAELTAAFDEGTQEIAPAKDLHGPASTPLPAAHPSAKKQTDKGETPSTISIAVAVPSGMPPAEGLNVQALAAMQVAPLNVLPVQASTQSKQTVASLISGSSQLAASATQSAPAANTGQATNSASNARVISDATPPTSGSGRSTHGSSEDETHSSSVKSEAHSGPFAETLTQAQAHFATAYQAEGASFSPSLAGPAAHGTGIADAAGSNATTRVSAPSSSLLESTPASTPVRKLEIAVQDSVLGTVGVHAEMRGGTLHASLTGTQDAVGASLSGLHHFLQDQQIAVSSLSFSSSAERVNGTAHASGAGDLMQGEAGSDSSSFTNRQSRDDARQHGSAAPSAGTQRASTGSIPASTSRHGRTGAIAPGSTVSIHI